MNHSKVCVIGLGYIGLPTALLLAEAGHQVTGIDIDPRKLELLKKGELPFEEPGLKKLFSKVKEKENFTATKNPVAADFYIISVPTPQKKGKADLTHVKEALKNLQPVVNKKSIVIIESTIGPADIRDNLQPLVATWPQPVPLAHCPERAIPGSTLSEMINNDRIVGADDPETGAEVKKLYASFVKGKFFITSTTIAAAAKVMENTYRAVNIALANEFAQLAEKIEFNVWEAIQLANKHPRVNIHQPGPGVGGHCIPIDPWFFVSYQPEGTLIEKSLLMNKNMEKYVATQVKRLIKKHSLTKPTIGVLGYAYKPNVDDARETPAQGIIDHLKKNFDVIVTDPHVTKADGPLRPLEDVLQKAQVLIVVTAHDVYKKLNLSKYPKIIFVYDTHNCVSPLSLNSTAKYYVLGSPNLEV